MIKKKEVVITIKEGDKEIELKDFYEFDECSSIAECLEHAKKATDSEEKGTPEEIIVRRYNYNTERYAQQSVRNNLLKQSNFAKQLAEFKGWKIQEALDFISVK